MEHHFGAVDETTKRLVGRCVRVPWLEGELIEREKGMEKQAATTATTTTTTTQKLLSVAHAGGMASSLSMAEVTTQKEKPGVQVPSLERQSAAGNQTTNSITDDHDGGAVVVVAAAANGDSEQPRPHKNVPPPPAPPEKSPFEVSSDGET